MPTTDFMTALVALTFAAQPPMMLVAVPPTVLAAYHAAAYCAAHFSGHPLWQRHGARLHALMLAKQVRGAGVVGDGECRKGRCGYGLVWCCLPTKGNGVCAASAAWCWQARGLRMRTVRHAHVSVPGLNCEASSRRTGWGTELPRWAGHFVNNRLTASCVPPAVADGRPPTQRLCRGKRAVAVNVNVS